MSLSRGEMGRLCGIAVVLASLAWGGTSAAQQPAKPAADPPASLPAGPDAKAPAAVPKTPAPSPALAPPAPSAGQLVTPEAAHLVARSPAHMLQIALSYAALADSQGDPWDALLALTYFERARAGNPKLATLEVRKTMDRMRQLAGQRPYRPPLPGVRYPVYFSAHDSDDEFDVEAREGRCSTPCMLEMTSGPHAIYASGSGDIETDVFIPTTPSHIRLYADSDAMTVAGAVLVPVGVVVGGGLWAFGIACDDSSCAIANFTAWPVLGMGLLISGIVLLAMDEEPPPDANRIERVGVAPSFSPVLTPGPAGGMQMTGATATMSATF